MKSGFALTFLLVNVSFVWCQVPSFKGVQVYAQLDGNAMLGIHAEHLVFKHRAVFVNAHIGLSGVRTSGADFSPCVPISINTFFLKGNHHPEVGVGVGYYSAITTSYSGEVKLETLEFCPMLAYRYQRPSGGLFAKVSWTPFITIKQLDTDTLDRKDVGLISVALAVGYYFARE